LLGEDKLCAACGRETAVIGHDESEQLDVEPARYFVRVTKREKRACHGCQQGTVRMARLEPRIVEKGLASEAVVIDTVVAKYCDHLPLYRQASMLERETGLEISRATLNGWVMRVGELLPPVVQAMRKDLRTATYLQADETTVPVQMHDGRGAITKLTYGNTASLVEKQCSIFAWGAVARVRSSFWANGKASCKPTATRPTMAWADRSWRTSVVGRTHGASLWTR
jgi:transposase